MGDVFVKAGKGVFQRGNESFGVGAYIVGDDMKWSRRVYVVISR